MLDRSCVLRRLSEYKPLPTRPRPAGYAICKSRFPFCNCDFPIIPGSWRLLKRNITFPPQFGDGGFDVALRNRKATHDAALRGRIFLVQCMAVDHQQNRVGYTHIHGETMIQCHRFLCTAHTLRAADFKVSHHCLHSKDRNRML